MNPVRPSRNVQQGVKKENELGSNGVNRFLIVVCLVLFSTYNGLCGESKRGTSAAQFLKFRTPRIEAMGGATVAVIDGVASLYSNPAGLARLQSPEIYASHNQLLGSLKFDTISYGYPLKAGHYGAIGTSFLLLSQSDITKYDNTGTAISNFAPSSMAGVISYAKAFSGISVGGSAKFIKETLDDVSSQTQAFDFGLIYTYGPLSFGSSLSNAGGNLAFLTEKNDLPMLVQTGIGLKFLEDNLILGADVTFPKDNKPVYCLGAEYTTTADYDWTTYKKRTWNFSLRGGFISNLVSDIDDDGLPSGISVGLGIQYNNKTGMDFTFVPYGNLGNSFQIGLYYRFTNVSSN